MKKITTFLLVTVILALTLMLSSCEQYYLEFEKQSDGTYIVENIVDVEADDFFDVVIPDTYKGGAVVGIGDLAFYDSFYLRSVTIPDSVTYIGRSAFDESLLFYITIPDSVTSIGDCAFAYTLIQSITIPNSITSINEETFFKCVGLKSATIPDSVTSIGSSAFAYCVSLETINFEGTVEQWNAIQFGDYWNINVPATEVICSDGTVPLD